MSFKIITYNLDPWQENLSRAGCELSEIDFVNRLLIRDHTLWKETDLEISNRLGWLDCPTRMIPLVEFYREQAEKLKKEGITGLVLLGMGGSALAPEAISQIIGPAAGFPRLLMLDSTCPSAVRSVAKLTAEKPGKQLFLISSKSGTTAETLSFLNFFYHQQQEIIGPEAGQYFAAITDPETPLEKIADRLGFRWVIKGFPDVGGRFSALSPFGLFPAALMGLNLTDFLQSAVMSYELLKRAPENHPGLILGTLLGRLATSGLDKLTFIMPSSLKSLGRWLEQLIAESTGKEGQGILPVLESLPVPEETYGPDRLFVFYEREDRPDIFFRQKMEKIKQLKYPIIHMTLKPEELAGHFYLWEIATAVAGYFLRINPFDQPDVELTKKKTRELLQTPSADFTEEKLLRVDGDRFLPEFKSFLQDKNHSEYLSLLCFLPPSETLEVALDNLARQLAEMTRLPVTWNFGPAYLHSTGQLHKGDSGRGKFIGLVYDEPESVDIPELEASPAVAPSFNLLFKAQALADLTALRERARQVLGVLIKENPVGVIFGLSEMVRKIKTG